MRAPACLLKWARPCTHTAAACALHARACRTLLTKGEVISALGRIRVECNKVNKMCLFSTYYTKSSRLDEMEQAQLQTIDQTSNYLKDTW